MDVSNTISLVTANGKAKTQRSKPPERSKAVPRPKDASAETTAGEAAMVSRGHHAPTLPPLTCTRTNRVQRMSLCGEGAPHASLGCAMLLVPFGRSTPRARRPRR
jgi:hypothetical protein